jgi:DNA-binding MarR family transcriptional regulator
MKSGQRLVTKVPDVTRLLDRMEAAGLIVRQRGGRGSAVCATRITEKGLKLLDKIDRELPAMHGRQLGHVGQKRLRELIRPPGGSARRAVREFFAPNRCLHI